ncbi:MAG TPA: sulfatase-like hydrolase/transferase [Polyangiales bacterium]
MRGLAQALSVIIVRGATFGAVVGCLEAGLVVGVDGHLFLTGMELARFALLAVFANVSVVVALALVQQVALTALVRARRLSAHDGLHGSVLLATTLVALPACAWVLWALSQGRRVRDLPARPWLVLGFALAASLLLSRVVRLVAERAARPRPAAQSLMVGVLAAACVLALLADSLVLRRLYPAFHLSLALSVWLLVSALSVLCTWPRAGLRGLPWLGAAALACALCAPFALRGLADAPNARFAVELAAPLTGKLLRSFAVVQVAPTRVGTTARSQQAGLEAPAGPSLDLRGQDILLITIDALRADRLQAYGGHGLTPALDELARQSVVFSRAYTSTPHTSYAIGSLLTGKYLRPVLSLPNAPSEHATLPRLLRRYGYRTAAFYPPAIFFVDKERFQSLQADHFGFEYVKEMFAPADQRVEQIERYLDQSEPGHPLFVWVHLFEPHEPYEPPAAFRRGDELVDLYDGEVAAADASAGKLVELFRQRRPSSTVIVTADHGEEFADHGGYHHGTTVFEEQVHVPLLWSSAGKTSARVVDAAVEHVDVATTLLAALAIPRDARMRGDDLGRLMLGDTRAARTRAFASTDELQMWTDGRWKVLCDQRSQGCRLFDLLVDPTEQRDVSTAQPAVFSALRGELIDFVSTLPQVEAVAMEGGGGWPKALARARLGDVSVGPELLGLLGSDRSQVRAEALRAIAALHVASAARLVATLRASDPDAGVRDEAALTALALGDDSARAQVRDVLQRHVAEPEANSALARRAALLCDPAAEPPALAVLVALAADERADEVLRIAAVRLLGKSRAQSAVAGLIPVLCDVRVRGVVARALGEIGGRLAADAVAGAFEQERYPEARAAEAAALFRLHDPRASRLVLRLLGTETGVPGGLLQLLDAGTAPMGSGGVVFDLRGGKATGDQAVAASRPAGLAGSWSCERARGCSPTADDASLRLPELRLSAGSARVVVDVAAAETQRWLEVLGVRHKLAPGATSLGMNVALAVGARSLGVRASPGTYLLALGILRRSADIPPPAPKAFDAGVDPRR